MNWFYYSSTGEIGYHGNSPSPPIGASTAEHPVTPDDFWVNDGLLTQYTPEQKAAKQLAKNDRLQWSNATMSGHDPRTLDDLKAAKNDAIDSARGVANSTTFTFQGRTIAVDATSKGDIMGAHGEWLTGQAPAGWPGGWKTKDKTPEGDPIYVAIPDLATWLQFYRAMVAQGTANFNHSQALKAQLAAATTPDEVEAVPEW